MNGPSPLSLTTLVKNDAVVFAGDTKILVSFWHGPAVLRQGFLILFDQYVTSSAVGLQSNELAFITLLISDITSSLFISIHSYI